ncbi:hypothetical protein [Nonomuraea sp. NPDC005650]|uniref:hypothetical protein n=1 Tax=Nonomuraea sp. NPDC005650 TaxID=3157045 RepID=UPI0033B51DCE
METAPSFAADIKPLFREMDRQAMLDHFDLWSYDDVWHNGQRILDKLITGAMPCDGAWGEANVATFQNWLDSGMNP